MNPWLLGGNRVVSAGENVGRDAELALPYIPILLTQKQMDQKDDMAIVKAPQHVAILLCNVIHLGPCFSVACALY
jgi:hypothetical protein